MATDLTLHPKPHVLDLTGLPEAVVRQVEQLVGDARRGAAAPRSPNQDDPDRWSAELRAWVASHPKRDIAMDDSREGIYEGCGE
ncbi:MAG: hypothetical protein K2X87_04880 [Gemmataceae bacterium]|nr:hypothetical protein [Gemmataceae bacterium]